DTATTEIYTLSLHDALPIARDDLAEETDAPQLAEGSIQHALPAPDTVALVPDAKPVGSVTDRVLATLAEIETQTGPRLELTLIRAQLGGSPDHVAEADLAGEL